LFVALTELPTMVVQVDVAFSVVRMETQYGTKHGVATSWLDRLAVPLTGPQAAPDPALVKASDDTLRVPVRGCSSSLMAQGLFVCWHMRSTMSGAMPSQRIGDLLDMPPSVHSTSLSKVQFRYWTLC
jgi:hypothetical protein